MGVNSAELYLNVGLCCFFAQQLDLALGCIEQAHARADAELQADLWFNTAHIAFVSNWVKSKIRFSLLRIYYF